MKRSTEEILEYMQDKYNRVCPLGVYLLDYFIMQDLLKISERKGRIVGVIIFRKIKMVRYDPRDLMGHDGKGDCAYVVELCADDKEAIDDLERQMRARLGESEHMGMTRRGKAKFYNYNNYIGRLLRKDKS